MSYPIPKSSLLNEPSATGKGYVRFQVLTRIAHHPPDLSFRQVIVAYNRIRDELLEKIEARLQAVSYTLAELKTHTDATVETNEISQDLEIEEADEETNSISDDWGWSEDQEDKSTTTEEGVRKKSADDSEDIDANDWTWWTQN